MRYSIPFPCSPATLRLLILSAFLASPLQAQTLTEITRLEAHDGGLNRMLEPTHVVLSPNEEHLYVAASFPYTGEPYNDTAGSLTHFARDAQTGRLTPVAAYDDATSGPFITRPVYGLILSPDGQHVYTRRDGYRTYHSRTAATGQLTLEDLEYDTTPSSGGSQILAMSPDGRHLYEPFRHYNPAHRTETFRLRLFLREASTGRLTEGAEFLLPASLHERPADAVTTSPDGRNVYLLGQFYLASFSRDATTGALTFLSAITGLDPGVRGLKEKGRLTVSPDGRSVYAVTTEEAADGTRSGYLTAFARDETTGALSFLQVLDATDGLSGFEQLRAVTLSPDGAHLYLTSSTLRDPSTCSTYTPDCAQQGHLTVFDRDAATGGLTSGSHRKIARMITQLAFSSDGRFAYAPETFSRQSAVYAFERNAATGTLTLLDTYRNHSGGIGGVGNPHASPDGRFLYTGSPADSSVTLSTIDPASGIPAFVKTFSKSLIRTISALSGDGRYVFQVDHNAVNTYTRDAETGDLTLVHTLPSPLGGADFETMSNAVTNTDGTALYVGGRSATALAEAEDRLFIFTRNPDGSLQYAGSVEAQANLKGNLALSPDGTRLVHPAAGVSASGGSWDRIAVYTRTATGLLAPDGFSPVDAPALESDGAEREIYTLLFSPDGRHLVASVADATSCCVPMSFFIHVSRLDPATGRYAPQATSPGYRETGTFSPDGRFLYYNTPLGAYYDGSSILTAYLFDFSSGALGAEVQEPLNLEDSPGLTMEKIVVHPSGSFIYTAARYPTYHSVRPFLNVVRTEGPTLPVELTSFQAIADGPDVHFTWQTASETNNAGFEIQMGIGEWRLWRMGNASSHNPQSPTPNPQWESVGWVEGHGTTAEPRTYTYRLIALEPGTYRFRLKQVDFDGGFIYSPEVELTIELTGTDAEHDRPGTHWLTQAYPNPFNPRTSFTLTVSADQPVRIDVFDATGRRVTTLHEGVIPANVAHRFALEAGSLPSGLYLIQASGRTFRETRSVTLLR